MKGNKMIKSPSFGSRMRKRLSDITNLQSQSKSPFKNQENVLTALEGSGIKINMDKLLQENAVMLKLIEEKDKIIESSGVELQKLGAILQRTQLQNLHLAQSNAQMFAELNMCKDRLKTLQHELICKEALSKAMTLELKEKAKVSCETNGLQEGKTEPEAAPVEQPLKETDNDNNKNKVAKVRTEYFPVKPPLKEKDNDINKNQVAKVKRGRPARSQSMGPTTSQQAVDKEMVENKRRCLRRQSVRLNPPEKQGDLFEIEVANDAVNQTTDLSRRKSNSVNAEDEEYLSESSRSTRAQRPSIGRPQRKATEKVQSYKDPPLNTKMRRPVS